MGDAERGSQSGSSTRRSLSPDVRILIWAGVAVALLLVAAVVLSFVKSPQLEADSPEGVVQRYLQAVVEGRRSLARSYLSDRLQR